MEDIGWFLLVIGTATSAGSFIYAMSQISDNPTDAEVADVSDRFGSVFFSGILFAAVGCGMLIASLV